jgi:hypothetical protein
MASCCMICRAGVSRFDSARALTFLVGQYAPGALSNSVEWSNIRRGERLSPSRLQMARSEERPRAQIGFDAGNKLLFLELDAEIRYADAALLQQVGDRLQHLLLVDILLHLNVDRTDRRRIGEGPEVRLAVGDHAGQILCQTTKRVADGRLLVDRYALVERLERRRDERYDRRDDQHRDDDRADRVGRRPAFVLHQERRDDHTDGTESVGEDVLEEREQQQAEQSATRSITLIRHVSSRWKLTR